jgi:hypothetical protein
MKRTTISLPDDLAAAAEREAERRRISMSELVRQALADRLGMNGQAREVPFAGIGDSGRTDVSERIEEILDEEYADHILEDSHRDR